ncbi:MAG: D-alanine--D-alanine ligase family protein [Solirubrobacteraceae bacterium]|jgi:D-alanine-D-alanine ligase
MRVAVLGGGRSGEHAVSLASAAAVREGLEAAGHSALAVEITREGRWRHEDVELTLTPAGGLLDCDVAFPALHGPYGEDGVVQGVLECLDIPYVGSDIASSALCIDKVRSKQALGGAGIPQVDYRAVEHRTFAQAPERVADELVPLGLPVFVKPARMGSSVGIAKVTDAGDALVAALAAAFEHDERAIVEASARGLEVECSLLGNRELRTSPPGEIVLHSDFYDYAAKYEPNGMELVVPARISPAARAAVQRLAVEAFELCGCAGLARADFFVDGEQVLLNELNTMPGFTATSVYAKLWQADGLAYASLVDELCRLGIERHARTRSYVP